LHQDFEVRAAYTFGSPGSSSPSGDDISYYAISTDLYHGTKSLRDSPLRGSLLQAQ
jgi:hypothetical protein